MQANKMKCSQCHQEGHNKRSCKQDAQPTPAAATEKVSRGSNCFKKGKEYQTAIYNILNSVTVKGKKGSAKEVEGAKSGPDITYNLEEATVGFEVKDSGAFEGGSRKLQYNGTRLVFEKDTFHSTILGETTIYEGLNLPWYTGQTSQEEYDKVKAVFQKDIYINVEDSSIADYYKLNGVHYIQIQGKGLYHTGTDILELGVPKLLCKQRMRIRTSKHLKKGIPTDVVGDFNYDKKSLAPSCYSLDGLLPTTMKKQEAEL